MRVEFLSLLCKHCLHSRERLVMSKQGVHPSGRVVSVRLDEETIERLDNLSERTGRSRGFYLKLAIRAMLPAIEQKHWEHARSEEHTSELQSRGQLVCRLLLEKKK